MSVTAESPIVDVKQTARQTNIRAEQVELLPARTRLHDARDAGSGRQPGTEARWSLDRRRERRREPLHHRRHRDDEPAERHLGQEPDRRLRRRSAGQVQRLHGRVRRRDGRRHQRRHQEWLERLPWVTALFNFQGSALSVEPPATGQRSTSTRRPLAQTQPGRRHEGRVHHVPEGRRHPHRTRLLAGRSDRRSTARGSIGAYHAGVDQHDSRRRRSEQRQPRRECDLHRANPADAVPDVEPDRADRAEPPRRASRSTTAGQDRRTAAVAERHRPVGHELHARRPSSRTGRCRATSTGWHRPKLFFGVRGGYYVADQHDTNVTEEPRYLLEHDQNVGMAGVPVEPAACNGFHEHSDPNIKVTRDQQTRAYFQADGTATPTLAASTRSSSACRWTALATMC